MIIIDAITVKRGIEISSRGGVKNTWLEVKAKDTKKRGQGQEQPFRGQTLWRPRTEMLKTQAQVFSKKSLQKIFQAISKKGKQIRSSQIFRELSGVFLHNCKNKQIPTIVGTDANAHCTIWGSSDTKP